MTNTEDSYRFERSHEILIDAEAGACLENIKRNVEGAGNA